MKRTICCLLMCWCISYSAVNDTLLKPVCASDQQILFAKENSKITYTFHDSLYSFLAVTKFLKENPASSPYIRQRNILLAIGIPLFAIGATIPLVEFSKGNYNFTSPLNLVGNIVMFTGLGITIGSSKQVKLAIYAFNKNACGK